MAKNKKSRREEAPTVEVVKDKSPLVSVIIPMYNSAKFIPQTLESLLYQTMTDFEVVVVDDCSTDNSVEVVESFANRFGGRLHVIKLRENSGTPGIPRNVGIQYARGKYIAFLDSDDLFTPTALEELTTLAEKYQAEVVHTDRWFFLWNGRAKNEDDPSFTDMIELTNPNNFVLSCLPINTPIDHPFLLKDDLDERIKDWVQWRYRWGTCSSFCNRCFLISNQIFFSSAPAYEDMFFNFSILSLSKNYLRIPNSFYIVRPHVGSIIREESIINLEKYFSKWLYTLNENFKAFEQFMNKISFFQKHANYRYAVLEFLFHRIIEDARQLSFSYAQIPAFMLNELVKREFQSDDTALTAYLFNTVNIQRLQLLQLQYEFNKLKSSK